MGATEQETPDEVLVLAAILGDLDAFGELASRYHAAAVRTAQYIVGRDDAEDVAQDAMMLAFKALPSIDEPSSFAAWLGAITRHRATRHLRNEGRMQRVPLDDVLLERIEGLVKPSDFQTEAEQETHLALDQIPKDYALVLRLHFLDEMPLKHIGAFLGVPLSTVKWRIHKGKELMREKVKLLRKDENTWTKTKSLHD